jgi:hypothetical protein
MTRVARAMLGSRAMRIGRLASLVLVAAVGVLSGCSSMTTACSLELRSYRVDITRDVTVDAAKTASLSVETCVDGTCTTGTRAPNGTLTFSSSAFRSPTGSLVANAADKMTLTLQMSVNEGTANGTTPIVIRVLDASGAKVHDSTAEVRWNDDDCHPQPESTKL